MARLANHYGRLRGRSANPREAAPDDKCERHYVVHSVGERKGEIAKGTYTVQRNRINCVTTKGNQVVNGPMIFRDNQIWDGSFLWGFGSSIYCRPGKKPVMPASEKQWPSFSDFYSKVPGKPQ